MGAKSRNSRASDRKEQHWVAVTLGIEFSFSAENQISSLRYISFMSGEKKLLLCMTGTFLYEFFIMDVFVGHEDNSDAF